MDCRRRWVRTRGPGRCPEKEVETAGLDRARCAALVRRCSPAGSAPTAAHRVGPASRERRHSVGWRPWKPERRCLAHAPRARGMGRVAGSRRAMVSGSGKAWVRPGISVATGVPCAATSFPASMVAAWTVICWPRMARTASSKPSQAPGTRRPTRYSAVLVIRPGPEALASELCREAGRARPAHLRRGPCGSSRPPAHRVPANGRVAYPA